MQRLEVSGAVRLIYRSLGVKGLIRTLAIPLANYPDLLVPSGKFVENSTALTCLESTRYRIKCSGFWNFQSGVVQRFRRRYTL